MKFKKFNKIKRILYKRKRKFSSLGYSFKFGDKGLFSRNQFRIEKIHIKILRKIFKKKLRKRRKKLKIHNKYWIRFSQNLLLTKKSKNARMGSGKGKYYRACFVLKPNHSFIEFKNYDYYMVCWLRSRIFFKINMHLLVLVKNFKHLTIS